MLCNKVSLMKKKTNNNNKKNLLQNSKKVIQKIMVTNVIFLTLVKNKEHISYHRAHYTHKSHIQAQTQR